MSDAPVLACLLVLVVLFFVCREFWCWYWKINQTVSLLIRIHEELGYLGRQMRDVATMLHASERGRSRELAPAQSRVECPFCQHEWTAPNGALRAGSELTCPSCGKTLMA